jgi:hypothetical protein
MLNTIYRRSDHSRKPFWLWEMNSLIAKRLFIVSFQRIKDKTELALLLPENINSCLRIISDYLGIIKSYLKIISS